MFHRFCQKEVVLIYFNVFVFNFGATSFNASDIADGSTTNLEQDHQSPSPSMITDDYALPSNSTFEIDYQTTSSNFSDSVDHSWSPLDHDQFPKIILPTRPTGPGHRRWGPFFEHGTQPTNVSVRLGNTAYLDCSVGLLYDKTVMWVLRKGDSIFLLTVGSQAYSLDKRIALNFIYPNNWRLCVHSITEKDRGQYECQVATHPPISKIYYLEVIVPTIRISDEKEEWVTERFYKHGSFMQLSCQAKNVQEKVSWWKANKPLTRHISTNESSVDGVIWSILTYNSTEKSHSGNYTCSAGHEASASVSVHVLSGRPSQLPDGNFPAAVYGGCSITLRPCWILLWIMAFNFFLSMTLRFSVLKI